MISLFSGLPGTMATAPDFAGFIASALKSSRSFDLRCFSSGPWHWKQVSEKIGRMSRLNSIFAKIVEGEIRARRLQVAKDRRGKSMGGRVFKYDLG